MLVTNIEITRHRDCPESDRQSASVCMTLGNDFVTMICSVPKSECQSAGARTAAFVREAARQIKRMPEFRSGRISLEFQGSPFQTSPELA